MNWFNEHNDQREIGTPCPVCTYPIIVNDVYWLSTRASQNDVTA